MLKILKEITNFQKDYRNLSEKKKLTKKSICDLVIPFSDRYDLSNMQALAIARGDICTYGC